MLRTVLAACIISCVLVQDSSSEWRTDGLVMPKSHSARFFEIHPDGSGGALVAYDDNPTALAQRIDSLGALQWSVENPLITRKLNINSVDISSVPDGSQGLIVLARRSDGDLRAQRIDASGTLLWGADGIAIATAPAAGFYDVKSVSDGAGGAYLTWLDSRAVAGGYYATHLLASGTIASGWAPSGNAIASNSSPPFMRADGSGGIYLVWTRRIVSPRTEIRVLRMTSSGGVALPWPADGLIITPSDSTSHATDMALVGSDVVMTWTAIRPLGPGTHYSNGICAQRVSSNGTLMWGANGRAVRPNVESSIHDGSRVVPSGDGAVIVWSERPDLNSLGNVAIVAQRLDASGSAIWGTVGRRIVDPGYYQYSVSVVPDSAAGVFIVWIVGLFQGGAVMTQHLDESGIRLWDPHGIQVSRTSGTDYVGTGVTWSCL